MAESNSSFNEGNQMNSSPTPRAFAAGDVVCSSEPWVWSFQYEYHKSLCAYCFKESSSLHTCSGCKLYRYCNAECQAANWKQEHKHECGMLKKINGKLAKLPGNFDHDCALERWNRFGCSTAQILMAKIVNKLVRFGKDEVAGLDGKRSVMETLEKLPRVPEAKPPSIANVDLPHDLRLCEQIWPDAKTTVPNFDQLMQTVKYNAFVIQEPRGKSFLLGLGVFPLAPYREMTPVCWDMNVTMDFQGRTLVVRATQDIPAFTGMRDLRQAELLPTFVEAFPWRSRRFQSLCGYPCTCRKCTPEYEAEISPLKCVTPGCTERIPSDKRARQPCPQCGVINGERLKKLQKFVDLYNETADDAPGSNMMQKLERLISNIEELDKADIVYPDAYFRFVCGFSVAMIHQNMGKYDAAWKLLDGMIDCLRTLYPAYHINRARHLVKAGALPYLWAHRIGEKQKRRLKPVFDAALPRALEWLKEAQGIYEKLEGQHSLWAQEVAKFIARFASGKETSGVHDANALGKPHWNWNDEDAVFNW